MLFSKEEYHNIVNNLSRESDNPPTFVPVTKPDLEALNRHDCIFCPDENLMLIPVDVDDAKELELPYGETEFHDGKIIDLTKWKPKIEKK